MFKMTPNIMRNLVTKRATRRYPHEVRTPFERARGELFNDVEECTFCRVCAVKCPSQCITVDKKAATWVCDPFACVYCGICVEVCPQDCLEQKHEYRSPMLARKTIFMQGTSKRTMKGDDHGA